MKKQKEILTCCLDCGRKYDKKHKVVFGVWIGDCEICDKKKVPCASAPHDFGIYSSEELKIKDEIQDAI